MAPLLQVDAIETDSHYQLEVALPGIRKGASYCHLGTEMHPYVVSHLMVYLRVSPQVRTQAEKCQLREEGG